MQLYVESVLKSKGLTVSEEELKVLTNRWQALMDLREEVEKLKLGECDMALLPIPPGGWDDE